MGHTDSQSSLVLEDRVTYMYMYFLINILESEILQTKLTRNFDLFW